ncbi:MAG: hypothetical protein IKW97_07760 [Muribaculaceae bacterium]|nr:hypothetical protein [Muribaculaceae bacterium]
MTVKELKNALEGISEPIDRIAGFCDNYDQMFSHCEVRVNENTVEIDSDVDLFEPKNATTVAEAMAQVLALPIETDDYAVFYEGGDNHAETVQLVRDIRRINVVQGTTGIGISLQGPQPSGVLNRGLYVTKMFVNDERAKSLNEAFYEFLDELDATCDFMDSRDTDKGIFIDFVTDQCTSVSLIALMAGTFKNVVFCRTPFECFGEEICRLTNDHEGHCWGKRAAVFVPADDRESITQNGDFHYCIQDMVYAKAECDTEQEVEKFIAEHNPDEELGDKVVRIVSRYIDDPLDLILKPWPEDEYE